MLRIAIDGPGGAGKSSLAKAVAKKLGIIYVDTGALYRSIGLYMLNHGISPKDTDMVVKALSDITLQMRFDDGRQVILLNGDDVGETIRTPEVSMAASAVSAIGEVREFLLNTQRSIAEENDVIMDGRDIGTVILPYAEVKIFLTASPEARAKRRFDELCAKGIETTYEQVYSEMAERDKNDSTRAIAPCVQAEDAILLDNSNLDAEQTVEQVLKIVKKKLKQRNKKGSALYMFLRAIVAPVYRFFARVHVTGKENIPKTGGAVLCCNHIGINDILILGTVFPRQLRFLAKKEWFSVPFLSSLMRALGAVELDRGGKDVGALKNAVKLVKDGSVIAIFPQGHRYPGVNPATTPIKNGAALISYRAHGDIIPVCIKTKNEKYRFLRRIDIIIGEPMKYSELGFTDGGYDEYKAVTEKVFAKVCSLGGYDALPSPNTGNEKSEGDTAE
ncbi:MAG: (d)CMP kinase [Ruminococcaceae bacterium]|nr:(d)CMP kinase [Oscillospiraceae bacterium]